MPDLSLPYHFTATGRSTVPGAAGEGKPCGALDRPRNGALEVGGLNTAAAGSGGLEHKQHSRVDDPSAGRVLQGTINRPAQETVEAEPTRAPVLGRAEEAPRDSTVAGSTSVGPMGYIDRYLAALPKVEEPDGIWVDLNDSSDSDSNSDSDIDDVEALVTPSLGYQPLFDVHEHPHRLMSAKSSATSFITGGASGEIQYLGGPQLDPASTAYHLLQVEECVADRVEALLAKGTIQPAEVDQFTLRVLLMRLVKICTDHKQPLAFAETAIGTLSAFAKSSQLAAFAHEQHAAPALVLEGMCGLALLLAANDAPETHDLQRLMQSAHRLMGDVPPIEYHVRRRVLWESQQLGGHFVLRASSLIRTILSESSGVSVEELEERGVPPLADDVWLLGVFMELGALSSERGTGDGPFAAALWVSRCALAGNAACEAQVWNGNLHWATGRSYTQAQELVWSYMLGARSAASQLPESADRERREFVQVVDRVENALRSMGQWDWE